MATGLFGNVSMPKVGGSGKKIFSARVTQVILNNVNVFLSLLICLTCNVDKPITMQNILIITNTFYI